MCLLHGYDFSQALHMQPFHVYVSVLDEEILIGFYDFGIFSSCSADDLATVLTIAHGRLYWSLGNKLHENYNNISMYDLRIIAFF